MSQETMSFKLKNALTELDSLFQHIERFGKWIGLPKKQVFQINLALDELFTNIVSYGYTDSNSHLIDFRLSYENDTVVICIEDNGIPFDPVAAPTSGSAPRLEKCMIGGLGLHIVKKMMDEIAYERKEDKNIITIKKHIRS
jgi:anti-sigma regulatory factor (Ser/Thr protein kinase)